MTTETTAPKKSFFQNDRALVCSMLAFYGFCIAGLIVTVLWGLDRRNKTISANATSTAQVVATGQAKATATAVVRATEQARYALIDRFDSNANNWRSGYEYTQYWNGRADVAEGIYLWEIKKTKDTFISWADFSDDEHIKDFDVYVDTRFVEADYGDVCSGLIFRKSPYGWDEGGYYFALCNDRSISISYHTEKEGWQRIASVYYEHELQDWNRLEIIARGSHFTFLVNNYQVYTMDDTRQPEGGLALVVELNELVPAKIAFDNFGLQTR